MKRVTWIISDQHASVQFEDLIAALMAKGCELSFVLINMRETPFSEYCLSKTSAVTFVEVESRLDYLFGLFKAIGHYKKYRIQVIHAHLMKASIIGIVSAFLIRIPDRILTRHHSDFHHVYAKKGVIIDRILNFLATKVLAISKATASVLIDKEKVRSDKVVLGPHGFDFKKYDRFGARTSGANHPVVGVASRFIEWKGVQYIVEAFHMVIKKYPGAVLRLYGGEGSYAHQIEVMLSELPEQNREFHGFCSDMKQAYADMSVYVHVPITPTIEAYGQTYIEAAAMEVPCVFTLSGIAHEFVVNDKNALVVPYKKSEAIADAIIRLLDHPDFAHELGVQARKDVKHLFSIERQVRELMDLYQ